MSANKELETALGHFDKVFAVLHTLEISEVSSEGLSGPVVNDLAGMGLARLMAGMDILREIVGGEVSA